MKPYNYDIRRWTKGAIECYMRGCVCEGCPVYEQIFKYYPRGCQMKAAVIATVRKFGITDSMTRKRNILEE